MQSRSYGAWKRDLRGVVSLSAGAKLLATWKYKAHFQSYNRTALAIVVLQYPFLASFHHTYRCIAIKTYLCFYRHRFLILQSKRDCTHVYAHKMPAVFWRYKFLFVLWSALLLPVASIWFHRLDWSIFGNLIWIIH